jgi:lysophospholipase L1-like esterase
MNNRNIKSSGTGLSLFPNLWHPGSRPLETVKLIAVQLLTGLCMITLLFCCSKMPQESQSTDIGLKPKSEIAVHSALVGPDGSVLPSDPDIRYFGRWESSNPTQYISYWGGAYVRLKFTGTTVKVKVGSATNYYAKIDNGPWVSYINANGTVNLTSTALPNGTHTVTVAQGKDYNYVFNFQGFLLDVGATTSVPSVSGNTIEYIGDSITAGYSAGTGGQANVSGYGWICSEALGAEHTQIAFPGVTLTSGYNNIPGMDVQYFKLQNPYYPASGNWDFTKYTPKVIVVNLGTNDNGKAVPDNVFLNTYTTFLVNIRAKFANAEIFVMRTFLGVKAIPTLAAVNARIAAGDTKIHYINTTGWLTSADYADGLHPSVAGHIKAAGLLQPILAPYVGETLCLPMGLIKLSIETVAWP